MTARRGLTWSAKWHIVDEVQSHERYDVALCGTYLYNPEKEKSHFGGRVKYPEHLQRVIDGTKKSTGECKRCNKSAGRKSVAELLEDEDMAAEVAALIFKESRMVQGDAENLAWNILQLIQGRAS